MPILRRLCAVVVVFVLSDAARAEYCVFAQAQAQAQAQAWKGYDATVSGLAESPPTGSSTSMASLSIDPNDVTFSTITSSLAAPTTLRTTTRPAAAITSNFVLTATEVADGAKRRPTDSSSTLAFAIVIPLVALIALISTIVFRMYRTRKEREEAFAAEAAKVKTRAIEKQIIDLEAISENMLKQQKTDAKNQGDGKDLPLDIPIELEAETPKRTYHGI
ncbi:hypothetical protein GRF29_216g607189 [Pseudopithomyces chartarum]|uniref:Transmembrane protein n=1 Tax=Pseudopithomyces chartarum TaxID=1892770 RepID=A0AAN6RBP1_9PLEO|nr:hypothetical protein GRF29_216g607189 [Pseudopithomyces chartarum]